jgi:hypothetical protein
VRQDQLEQQVVGQLELLAKLEYKALLAQLVKLARQELGRLAQLAYRVRLARLARQAKLAQLVSARLERQV